MKEIYYVTAEWFSIEFLHNKNIVKFLNTFLIYIYNKMVTDRCLYIKNI